ncbi:MAG: GDP-L-fucose synthase [Sediminibacterium sp.]|nr:GDP-L-fucose synthase [Sediminibacterium sp.]
MVSKNSKIYIAGHRGMVGSAILKVLQEGGFTNLIYASRNELDLTNQQAVKTFFEREQPEIVILAAAKVGGIQANIDNPATFLIDNLQIQNNVISTSLQFNIKKFVFLGSSCIYPRESPQPMKEDYLLTGKLEPTNEGYAIAKIAGIKLLEAMYKQYRFKSISLMPCNLYGPNDSFDLKHSHVLSALVKRFSDAKSNSDDSITLWGSGIARREFMHVDDLAKAVTYMILNYNDPQFINIGSGYDLSIRELAEMIALQTGFNGEILWDTSKPDGMLRKCMDVTRMKELGFEPTISLEAGIKEMIHIYNNIKKTA